MGQRRSAERDGNPDVASIPERGKRLTSDARVTLARRHPEAILHRPWEARR
jgi:hypothetical protein